MDSLLHNKSFLKIVRIFSATIIFFLIAAQLWFLRDLIITSMEGNPNKMSLLSIAENFIGIGLLTLLLIFPHKLGFLALVSFIYTIDYLIFKPESVTGILMSFVCLSSMMVRGFFKNKGIPKIIVFGLLLTAATFSEIRFGYKIFIFGLLDKIGCSIFIGIISFFIYVYVTNIQKNKHIESSKKILNLCNYPDLHEGDVELLTMVLENKQYKQIAHEVHRAEGTVRNRLNKIYDKLNVQDRMGFITTYSGYSIVYKPLA